MRALARPLARNLDLAARCLVYTVGMVLVKRVYHFIPLPIRERFTIHMYTVVWTNRSLKPPCTYSTMHSTRTAVNSIAISSPSRALARRGSRAFRAGDPMNRRLPGFLVEVWVASNREFTTTTASCSSAMHARFSFLVAEMGMTG